jgi:hypothetical protein
MKRALGTSETSVLTRSTLTSQKTPFFIRRGEFLCLLLSVAGHIPDTRISSVCKGKEERMWRRERVAEDEEEAARK